MSRTSVDFLNKCISLQTERGKEYQTTDRQQEERSFAAVATIFNTKTGKNITAAEVCLLLQDLKDVRQWSQDRFHADSVEDSVSYASLKAEELSKQYNEGRCTRNMPITTVKSLQEQEYTSKFSGPFAKMDLKDVDPNGMFTFEKCKGGEC